MNQVFISNTLTPIIANIESSGSTKQDWSNLAHVTAGGDVHETAMCGIWDPYGQQFLDGTTAALSLIQPDNVAKITAADGAWATDSIGEAGNVAADQHVITAQPTSPQWLNQAFQIVQAMPSGQPVASPIIHTSQVKRLRWDPFNAPVLHKITAAASGLTTAVVSGDTLQLILVTRFPGDVARYEAQINPSGAVTNVTPALSAAFDNPKRIYRSSEFVCTTDVEADMHNAFADLVIADNASGKNSFSDFITTTISSNDLVLEAKFQGQIIDAFVVVNGNKSHTCGETTAPEMGVGSFAEVLSAEKKAQYSQGFFNRMYLPTGGVTSASTAPGSAGTGYDRLVIEYINKNAGMPGFNGQGNTSTATMYVPNDVSFAAEATGLAFEDVWGLSRLNADAAAAAVEYCW
tara:strand:- start:37388 stop:38602 length:1215 start_codon:yes stop_codon:yes gene_type:complete